MLQGVGEPVTAVGIDADGSAHRLGRRQSLPGACLVPRSDGRADDEARPADGGPLLREPRAARWRLGELPSRRARRPMAGRCTPTPAARTGWRTPCSKSPVTASRCRRSRTTPSNGYLHAAFTLVGDGSRLITGGNDGTLIEYDTATAKIAGEFLGGHTGEINAIAIAEKARPDGDRQRRPDAPPVEPEDARAHRLDVLCRQGIRDLDAAGLLLFVRRGRQADRLARQPGPREGRPLHPRRPAQEISVEPGDGAPRHHPEKRQTGGAGDAARRRQRAAAAA